MFIMSPFPAMSELSIYLLAFMAGVWCEQIVGFVDNQIGPRTGWNQMAFPLNTQKVDHGGREGSGCRVKIQKKKKTNYVE